MIQVKGFHDSDTGTWTYLVFDRDTKDAVLIDPVLNYDPVACRILTTSLNSVFSTVHTEGLIVHYILETHAHADHLSAAQFFKDKVPSAAVVIGDAISTTQTTFKNLLSLDESFPTDGRQFDVLVNDGTCLAAGSLEIRVIATPGHTPTCCSYQIGDHVFVGDALFLPHSGTGRCDFPNGSAGDLYDSITQKLYSLPDHLCLYTCHDYPEPGIAPQMCATVAEHKKANIHLNAETTKQAFIKFRTNRDAQLENPRLLFQSIQVNIQAGNLPLPDGNGRRFLKLPLGD